MSTSEKHTAVIAGVGNGTGIGAATARLFASKGYRVALIGRARPTATPNETSLDVIVASIKESGGEVSAFPIVAYDQEDLSKAFKAIEKVWPKSVRFALFNAANAPFGNLLDIEREKLVLGVQTQVIGAFLFGQEAVKAILVATGDAEEEAGHRGTMIYTGGMAAIRGAVGSGAHSASKFGIRGISQSIAREYGPKGIHTAHAIIGGIIPTDMVKTFVKDPKLLSKLDDKRKYLNADSIAKTYWFLHEQDPSCWTQELDLRPAHQEW